METNKRKLQLIKEGEEKASRYATHSPKILGAMPKSKYESETIKKYIQDKAYQDEMKKQRMQELISQTPKSKMEGSSVSPMK